jgi:hypothetical protein
MIGERIRVRSSPCRPITFRLVKVERFPQNMPALDDLFSRTHCVRSYTVRLSNNWDYSFVVS